MHQPDTDPLKRYILIIISILRFRYGYTVEKLLVHAVDKLSNQYTVEKYRLSRLVTIQ